MMRRISLALLALTASLAILSPMQASAQQIGTWNVYPSYWNATRNVVAGDIIYSLTDGNLLAYSTGDSEVRTFDCLTQLNGIKVSQIAYSTAAKRLIIAYDDSNIDLMNSAGEVLNLSALRDKSMTSKNLNGLCVEGKMAYLAMSFGVVEVDMQEGVFRNTYILDRNVQSVTLLNGSIYAATAQGVLRGKLSDNLQDKSKWTTTAGGNFKQLTTMGNEIIARANVNLYSLSPEGRTTLFSSGNFTFMNLTGGTLVWGNSQQINFCQNTGKVTTVKASNTWQDASYTSGTFWASEGEKGLRAYTLKEGQFVPSDGPIQPNSPKNDLAYRISWAGDRLLVAGGIASYSGNSNNPPTIMTYEDGKWVILDDDFKARYPTIRHRDFTHLVQDPADDTHFFAGSFRTGLYEYRQSKFYQLWNCDNSPIQMIRDYGVNYCSCMGLKYDDLGNLWMLNSGTDTIIRILHPNGEWSRLYYSEMAKAETTDDYLFTTSGVKFIVSRRTVNKGFFAFDTNGTPNNIRDDKHILRSTITNQDGAKYNPEEFYCLCEDLDGQVWAGTNMGLFLIPEPSKFFDNDFRFEQVKINRNDGSGLADYLLSGLSISCIAVDGGNRKWIGTHDDGLYLISADGQEMLHHFTTDDSPILSNSIQSLAVHPTTGMVMIATDKGLCSYVADATEGADKMDADDVLVVPNPVTADYTGPIAVRGLARDSEVKILSSSGQLVWSGTSAGGTFTWNGCNKQGKRVASGVYHVVANNAAGKNAIVTRIVIIK